MAFVARVGVAANQAFTRQTLATARAGQKIGAHWRPDGSIDFPNEWQALIFLSQHQCLVHGEDYQHDCREEPCRRGRHYQSESESESESRKVSFSAWNSCNSLDDPTSVRDVADEPRIMIMFISLPGTKRWLSARWEATTSSASSEDEEHCITYVIAWSAWSAGLGQHQTSTKFLTWRQTGHTATSLSPLKIRVIGRNLNR